MHDPTRQRLELILRQVDTLPALPAVAVQALQVSASDAAGVDSFCRALDADPAVKACVLKLVDPDAPTPADAAARLGVDAIRWATLAAGVFAAFGPGSGESTLQTNLWKHAVAVGACAELVCDELVANWGRDAGVQSGEAFLAGLLHDLGKLALDRTVPKSFAKVIEAVDLLRGNIADVERSILGVDHQVVGKRLAEAWQLPAALRDAIWLHGQLPQALPASVRDARLVNVVTLADLLVREQHLGYSGNYQFPVGRQILMDALGLLPGQIEGVLSRLVPAIERRAAAIGLDAHDQADLYRGAIGEANRELGRVADQLATRNRRLSIRSKYFEAVAAFQNVLRPDAPPAVVLAAIGQTAAAVLETPSVAAFSLPPGAGYVEVCVADAGGQTLHADLIDLAQHVARPVPKPTATSAASATPAEGGSPVRAVGPDLEWITAEVSPRLGGTSRYWVALESDGAVVGGVVWGASGDEAGRLAPQTQELFALASGWSLALRTCQIRDESRALAEQLAEVNRRLQAAQSEIYRTRMLTSVAQIAAGAAHEMNNPLMVISGRSQLLAATLAEPKDRDAAKLIYEKSQTLSDLITALMHFAKPEPPQPQPVEVATLLHTAIDVAGKRSDLKNRRVETRLADLPAAEADLGQMAGAVAEILINAAEATDAETGRVTLGGSYDAFGQRLVLTVTDNGRGMDAHTLAHAFDPFFSARTAGRRQGMGLAKAQRWIESSGGSVRLESQPGAGTRAIVILPAATATGAVVRPVRSVGM